MFLSNTEGTFFNIMLQKFIFLNRSKSALEAFIRAKYEHKKYIAREWVPPKVAIPKEVGQNCKSPLLGTFILQTFFVVKSFLFV